jgi:hypothetical protein
LAARARPPDHQPRQRGHAPPGRSVGAERLVNHAVERLGTLDALVLNHARSQLDTVAELEANTLDLTWAIDVRASLLLVRVR